MYEKVTTMYLLDICICSMNHPSIVSCSLFTSNTLEGIYPSPSRDAKKETKLVHWSEILPPSHYVIAFQLQISRSQTHT